MKNRFQAFAFKWVNLHRYTPAKRKVLFVGHHPTLSPVPGMENVNLSDGSNDKTGAGSAGGKNKSKTKKGGGKKAGGGADGVDGFVFVLNPDLDWSDVVGLSTI